MANDKWSGSNPWLGLAPYTEGTPLYGRTQESAVLSEIIKDNIATIVYGKSGIGKSSLLSAGISPILRSEQYIPVPLRLVHNTDVSYVEQIENRVRELVDCKDELPENVPDLGLWDFFHRHAFTKDGDYCQPVIILDQFEETYTLTDVEHKPEIITLFTELASLLNDIKPDTVLAAEASFTEGTTTSSASDDDFSFELSTESSFAYNEAVSFRFVICLREDKLYLLERNSTNIPSIKTNRYNLQALSPESALEVIMCPRPELFTLKEASVIIDKLADMGDEGIRTVDPAILSLFLYKYYEKQGQANYDNIFTDYYHEATKVIKDKSLAYLEDHLLTLGGYRNQIPVDDALSRGVMPEDIQYLLHSIIVRKEHRKGVDYIEFSHDRLCKEAKNNRENRKMLAEKKKNIYRIILISVCSLMLLMILFNAFYSFKMHGQNQELARNEKILIMMKDSLAIQNKELSTQSDLLKLQGDSLSNANIRLEENENNLLDAINRLRIANHINELQKDSLKISDDSLKNTTEKLKEALADNDNYIRQLESVTAHTREKYVTIADGKRLDLDSLNQSIYTRLKSFRIVYENLKELRDSLNYCNSITPFIQKSYKLRILRNVSDRLKGKVVPFDKLVCLTDSVDSLSGHYILESDFIYQLTDPQSKITADNSTLYNDRFNKASKKIVPDLIKQRNGLVKGDSKAEFIVKCKGVCKLGVVSEPGGSMEMEIFDERNCIIPNLESENKKSKLKEKAYEQRIVHLPYDKESSIKVVIHNLKKKDSSFAFICN